MFLKGDIQYMSEHKTLCMGCMEPLEHPGVCPNCGYDDSSPAPSGYLRPKTVLDGKYIVGKMLCKNGESALYLGYDSQSEEKVYVKEYMPDAICSRAGDTQEIKVYPNAVVQYKNYMSEFIELNKELTRLRTMSHIVAPIDMFSQNNTAYVIMKYTEAETLKQYLQDNAGELTWDQVKKLFPPLLTTLGCIHNAGILHRGISLDNILVTDRGELLLTGFSIAAVRTVNTDLAPELYTGYSAPEQYSAVEWVGTWTDVYAVAAVMYRLLTGCMPTEPMARVGNDDLLEPAKINYNVPANVSKVIMQAMRLNCDQRIRTVTDFVTKLFEQPSYMQKMPNGSTQTIPISVPKQQPSPKKRKKKNRKRAAAIANVFMIIGAAVLIGIVVAAFVMLARMLLPETNPLPAPDSVTATTPQVVNTAPTSEAPAVTTSPTETQPPVTEATTASTQSGVLFAMPDLLGKRYDSVVGNSIWQGKLELEPTYDYSEEYENGVIYEQDIELGTELRGLTKVKVKVSKGLAVVKIPDFMKEDGTKMTKEEYAAILDPLNIKYEYRTEDSLEMSDLVLGVYCSDNGGEVGDDINVAEGNTLIVYISNFNPLIEAAG